MIEIKLPPLIADLCNSCETISEKTCCGIEAFNFSPFNVVYHLTRWKTNIHDFDFIEICSEVDEFFIKISNLNVNSVKMFLPDFEAIMTRDQLLFVIGEIKSALSDGYDIYLSQKDHIDKKYFNFLNTVQLSP